MAECTIFYAAAGEVEIPKDARPINIKEVKPLHLSYAQYDLLLQLQTDEQAASTYVLERRLGGCKVAEALVDRGLLIPLKSGEGYCLTPKGIEVSNIIAALNQGGKTPGAIIKIIRESFSYE